MLNGLGLAEKLKLAFPRSTLANHPDIYVTSLIACASLESSGSSDAFDPARYSMATRCVGDRFVCEMLSSQFDRLRVILILGTHGWTAIQSIRCGSGGTVLQRLRPAGKLVRWVGVAEPREFPTLDEYAARRWNEYRARHPGHPPSSERTSQWFAAPCAKSTHIYVTVGA
jgi:hypothetical protein